MGETGGESEKMSERELGFVGGSGKEGEGGVEGGVFSAMMWSYQDSVYHS